MADWRERYKRGDLDCIHRTRVADVETFTAQTSRGRYSTQVPNPRMKLKHIATLCLLALGLAGARAQEPKSSAPAPAGAAPAAAATFTDAQLVEEFGWFIGKRVGLTELEFSKAEIDLLLKGIASAAAGKDSPYELEKIGPKMDEFMQKKQQAYMAKLKDKNAGVNTDFFNKLKANKSVVELPSGLRYEIVKEGEGASPKATDTVKVHYTGTLIDGSVFDSSVQRGEPTEFPLDQVIPGWTEGIQKMKKGGKIKLYVPPQLAYGDDGRPGIPPGSTLIFEVELLDIKPAGAAAPAPAQPAKK
jgi:FKBP-type peptidyl-prolyl cis-trans isomerase